MISNVPLSFSNELIGHHAMNHGNMDIGSWVDELQLTGDFQTDQQLWANHHAQHHAYNAVQELYLEGYG
jgi:hypothetical protein